ncbi:helix-turn-helix transcriptional regulator [Rhizobium leguminosarum]|jgi:transcriptional regulator with XRE-family HTH domain|uniref:helix-turn-helix domain-containing protein n=1 Tax=Rhizobium leguminosarum TaxID=384 RepID=UPI002E10586B|nr:helix-turn-helix transcriptional regulator [Rhizobium leguminosarum]
MDTIFEQITIIRAARVLAGLSQEDLAEAAGVSRQIVARLEGGELNTSIGHLERIRAAIEKAGVVFIPSTAERGPGVAKRRKSRANP